MNEDDKFAPSPPDQQAPYPGQQQQNMYPGQEQQAPYPGQPQQNMYPGQQMPPPAYSPPNPKVVVISQPGVVTPVIVSFGEFPILMTCPFCQAQIQTATRYEPGTFAWIVCILLFFFTYCFCWLPFVINGMKDVVHSCPNCKNVIGRFNRM